MTFAILATFDYGWKMTLCFKPIHGLEMTGSAIAFRSDCLESEEILPSRPALPRMKVVARRQCPLAWKRAYNPSTKH